MQLMFVFRAKTSNLLSLFIPFQAVYTASVALQLKITQPVQILTVSVLNLLLQYWIFTIKFKSAFPFCAYIWIKYINTFNIITFCGYCYIVTQSKYLFMQAPGLLSVFSTFSQKNCFTFRFIVLAFCSLQTKPAVTDLKLSLQSKSLDERFRHMIEPLEPRRSLVLRSRIKGCHQIVSA